MYFCRLCLVGVFYTLAAWTQSSDESIDFPAVSPSSDEAQGSAGTVDGDDTAAATNRPPNPHVVQKWKSLMPEPLPKKLSVLSVALGATPTPAVPLLPPLFFPPTFCLLQEPWLTGHPQCHRLKRRHEESSALLCCQAAATRQGDQDSETGRPQQPQLVRSVAIQKVGRKRPCD